MFPIQKKKRGRIKIKNQTFLTPYRSQAEALDFFRRYLLSPRLRKMFPNGRLEIQLTGESIALTYTLPKSEISTCFSVPIRITSRRDFDELLRLVQEFILDLYYAYEYERGNILQLTQLAVLLGVTKQAVWKEIQDIFEKFRLRSPEMDPE